MCFGKKFKILWLGLVLGLGQFVKAPSSDCQLDFQSCADLSLAIFGTYEQIADIPLVPTFIETTPSIKCDDCNIWVFRTCLQLSTEQFQELGKIYIHFLFLMIAVPVVLCDAPSWSFAVFSRTRWSKG